MGLGAGTDDSRWARSVTLLPGPMAARRGRKLALGRDREKTTGIWEHGAMASELREDWEAEMFGRRTALAAGLAALAPLAARGQGSWKPSKPIRMIVPYGPG